MYDSKMILNGKTQTFNEFIKQAKQKVSITNINKYEYVNLGKVSRLYFILSTFMYGAYKKLIWFT